MDGDIICVVNSFTRNMHLGCVDFLRFELESRVIFSS